MLVSHRATLTPFLCFSRRDTAGQERFKTITTAYYRGAVVWQGGFWWPPNDWGSSGGEDTAVWG